MTNVLIAGCGDVGTALGTELTEAGHRVTGLRRGTGSPASFDIRRADVTDPSTLQDLPDDLDTVVYLVSADNSDAESYRAAYVDGLTNLLAALEPTAPPQRRLIMVTSTAVYGQNDGEWVDENSPTEPEGFRGTILLEAEEVALAAPWRSVVVRLAGIYGPGRTRLIDTVRAGRATARRTPPQWTNRLHRDDCAGLLAHLALLDDPAEVYVGVDDLPAPRHEVLSWLAARLGVTSPVISDEPGGRGSNKRCRNRRLHDSGYDLRYPTYRDGYAELLAGDSPSADRA